MAGPLGVLAGGGALPLRIARATQVAGRPVFAVALAGWADPADWQGIPHIVERVGAAGRILHALRAHGVRQIVLCGRATRPSPLSLRPDAVGARLLARIGRAFLAGDDGLLRAVVRVLEEEGFEVLPVQAVLADALAGSGSLAGPAPDATAHDDIARGAAVLNALAAADVGQGVVVQQGLVLAVEAIEGTDAMLARAGTLRREGPGGVLVKLMKTGQDRRADLPAIGPATIAAAHAAGLRGIAVQAGSTIIVDRDATVAAAQAAGLFLVAIDANGKETTP